MNVRKTQPAVSPPGYYFDFISYNSRILCVFIELPLTLHFIFLRLLHDFRQYSTQLFCLNLPFLFYSSSIFYFEIFFFSYIHNVNLCVTSCFPAAILSGDNFNTNHFCCCILELGLPESDISNFGCPRSTFTFTCICVATLKSKFRVSVPVNSISWVVIF